MVSQQKILIMRIYITHLLMLLLWVVLKEPGNPLKNSFEIYKKSFEDIHKSLKLARL